MSGWRSQKESQNQGRALSSTLTVGRNKHLMKGSKKGAKKKVVDPISKKDWYDVKAPAVFNIRNVGGLPWWRSG